RQVDIAEGAALTVERIDTIGFFNLYGNVKRAHLDDANVRRAIQFAIDRDQLAEGLTFGTAKATVQMFGSQSDLYSEDLANLYPYDVEKAKEALADSGYGPGDLKLGILILNRAADKQVGEAVQQMLNQVGFDTNLN